MKKKFIFLFAAFFVIFMGCSQPTDELEIPAPETTTEEASTEVDAQSARYKAAFYGTSDDETYDLIYKQFSVNNEIYEFTPTENLLVDAKIKNFYHLVKDDLHFYVFDDMLAIVKGQSTLDWKYLVDNFYIKL